MREVITDYVRKLEDDKELLAKEIPAYPPYGKRMLWDTAGLGLAGHRPSMISGIIDSFRGHGTDRSPILIHTFIFWQSDTRGI